MSGVKLRPDLKTAGGEVCDILYQDRYVGSLVLVYREGDRICGSVQLEQEALSPREKAVVNSVVSDYIHNMTGALGASECDVLVTCSDYDQVITTASRSDELEESAEYDEEEPEVIWVRDADELEDWDEGEWDMMSGDHAGLRHGGDDPEAEEDSRNPLQYELVTTRETRHQAEYHVYDEDQEWVAEVFLRIIGDDVVGDIHWMFDPEEDEVEVVTNLVVRDFDQEQVDTFAIDHRYEGVIIESIELTHMDLLEEAEGGGPYGTADELEEYTVVLARDDQDMLTYEIYHQAEGGLPIGTATVDISRKQLSGFIDFRRPGMAPGAREKIATLVMQELDKEKDYSTISFTMLQGNRPVDEVVFENEPVH